MTESQYRANVQEFLTASNMRPGCFSTAEDDEEYFSWSSCDCCQSELGGTRHNITFATNDGQTDESAICSDCLYCLTYGRLPDLTSFDDEDGCPDCGQVDGHDDLCPNGTYGAFPE